MKQFLHPSDLDPTLCHTLRALLPFLLCQQRIDDLEQQLLQGSRFKEFVGLKKENAKLYAKVNKMETRKKVALLKGASFSRPSGGSIGSSNDSSSEPSSSPRPSRFPPVIHSGSGQKVAGIRSVTAARSGDDGGSHGVNSVREVRNSWDSATDGSLSARQNYHRASAAVPSANSPSASFSTSSFSTASRKPTKRLPRPPPAHERRTFIAVQGTASSNLKKSPIPMKKDLDG